MLSAALFLLANSLFLTLRLTGNSGSFPKPLSPREEQMYLERSLAGDLEARNILVEHNLRLVAHIIKKYYTQSAEQEDLISIGTIGLIKAVDTFRPERKTASTAMTPATPCVCWTWWAATTPCSRTWRTERSRCASGSWWTPA